MRSRVAALPPNILLFSSDRSLASRINSTASTFELKGQSLVDVGTSQGCLPVGIAKIHHHITGGGFDLPRLSSMFQSYVQNHGLLNRLRFFPGDFFKDPLPHCRCACHWAGLAQSGPRKEKNVAEESL
jgi:hypothetical protein